ncbi:YceI family protein [Pendulispora rubella]|uniref:YceI family protein n=1 Tax=Pendulispora rubella TaxID=2741070 RepID=A0ABZ2KRT6_9BACT
MAEPGQRHRIGPEHGRLIVRTSRQGLAAHAGHDLTIEVTRWRGEVLLAEDRAASSVSVTVETESLRVLEGVGGLKPLSERDKREIEATAQRLLDVRNHPELHFVSTEIVFNASGAVIDGTLTLLGRARRLRLDVTSRGNGSYRGTGTVLQSEYGIKPYTAFFGALKLADAVVVEADVEFTTSAAP